MSYVSYYDSIIFIYFGANSCLNYNHDPRPKAIKTPCIILRTCNTTYSKIPFKTALAIYILEQHWTLGASFSGNVFVTKRLCALVIAHGSHAIIYYHTIRSCSVINHPKFKCFIAFHFNAVFHWVIVVLFQTSLELFTM